jgi:hypothetical protein
MIIDHIRIGNTVLLKDGSRALVLDYAVYNGASGKWYRCSHSRAMGVFVDMLSGPTKGRKGFLLHWMIARKEANHHER